MATKKLPLGTRLEPRRLPLLADEAMQLEVMGKWADDDHQKLLLLCDEMGVPDGPQRFYLLSLALARRHIIGFQERIPQGKWTQLTLGFLYVEIRRLTADQRKQPGHTVAWAADTLSRRAEWKEFLGGKGEDRGEALRVQYQRFMQYPMANAMLDAFWWHRHAETLSEWDGLLRDALRDPHP